MKIKGPDPNQTDLDRVRYLIYREWMRRDTPLPPRLLDPDTKLHVVGPFWFYRPLDPVAEWRAAQPARRPPTGRDAGQQGQDKFESVTVRIPKRGDQHQLGTRFLVTDHASKAIVAIADFTNRDGLVGSLDDLRLGTGAVTSVLAESLQRLEDKLPKQLDGTVDLEFVLDVERGVTVILARADNAVYVTALPPAWCALPAAAPARAAEWSSAEQGGDPIDGGVLVLTGQDSAVELWRKVPPPYEFEETDDKRVRGRGAARDAAYATLLDRIGAPDSVLRKLDRDGSICRKLDRFCADYVLNIKWYDEHLQKQKRWRIFWNAIFLAVGTLAVAAASWMAWHGLGDSTSPATVGAQVTVVIGGLVGVLKTLASLSDTKTRMALFWMARSNLKERLYRFEHRWRDRVVVDGDLAPGFLADLEDQLEAAARISATEQLRFFATYKDPSDVIDSLTSTAEQVISRATAMSRRDGTDPATSSAEHIDIIRANVDACAARLAELKQNSASRQEIDRAESALKIALATLSQAAAAQTLRSGVP